MQSECPPLAKNSHLGDEQKKKKKTLRSKEQIQEAVPAHSDATATQSHCVLRALLRKRLKRSFIVSGSWPNERNNVKISSAGRAAQTSSWL